MASLLFNCSNCIVKEKPPNIRTETGIEYCGAMCQKFKDLNCVGYFEDVTVPKPDETTEVLSCENWCIYEMSNSVQLNPKCLSENLKTCDEIETICQ